MGLFKTRNKGILMYYPCIAILWLTITVPVIASLIPTSFSTTTPLEASTWDS